MFAVSVATVVGVAGRMWRCWHANICKWFRLIRVYGGMRLVVGIENTYEERGSASLLKMVYVNLCFRCFLWKKFYLCCIYMIMFKC